MKRYMGISLIAALSACGCDSSHNGAPVSEAETYLAAVATLQLDPKQYESYQQYHDLVNGRLVTWLKQIDDPDELKTVFWQCHSLYRSRPEHPLDQERLTWIDPHQESLNLILYQLAETQTDPAAKVLVDLYSDPKAGWDAHAGEMALDAVIECGKIAIPFLKDQGERASLAIEMIESGKRVF